MPFYDYNFSPLACVYFVTTLKNINLSLTYISLNILGYLLQRLSDFFF